MLLWLAQYFQQDLGFLRVFNFITFRAVFATITAVLIGLFAGPAVIRKLTSLKVGQAIRQDGPQTHLKKHGTPTMGGILILLAIGISTLLWCDLSNRLVWPVLVKGSRFMKMERVVQHLLGLDNTSKDTH